MSPPHPLSHLETQQRSEPTSTPLLPSVNSTTMPPLICVYPEPVSHRTTPTLLDLPTHPNSSTSNATFLLTPLETPVLSSLKLGLITKSTPLLISQTTQFKRPELLNLDLQAALAAEPDNPEAKALLHQRSVNVEKLLSPLQSKLLAPRERLSNEIWQEIALYLPRRDLKALLFVPHPISRIASQILFRKLDLHFTGISSSVDGNGIDSDDEYSTAYPNTRHTRTYDDAYYDKDREREKEKDEDARHAQRSADILTRIIVDQGFAHTVRTLRIFASSRTAYGGYGLGAGGGHAHSGHGVAGHGGSIGGHVGGHGHIGVGGKDRDGAMAFQMGMLSNALPKLVNLRNVHLTATSNGILAVLKTLQTTSPKLRGLSIKSSDGPIDMSFLELRHLAHFAFTMNTISTSPSTFHPILTANKTTLRTISLESPHPSPHWTFPTTSLSIRNLTIIYFTGHFPAITHAFSEILSNGRQLENLTIECCALECGNASSQFRSVLHNESNPLPFLRNFAFSVHSIGRRTVDRDLFPAIAEFLRGRRHLRSLQLVAYEENVQHAVGFDASVWGVLPSLEGLRGLKISYPGDLAPGLASWLIPRSVLALRLTVDLGTGGGGGRGESLVVRDPIGFLSQLRHGIPPTLRFIGFSDINIRNVSAIVEHGFPMVRVVRIGGNYWTVVRNRTSSSSSLPAAPSISIGHGSAHDHGHPSRSNSGSPLIHSSHSSYSHSTRVSNSGHVHTIHGRSSPSNSHSGHANPHNNNPHVAHSHGHPHIVGGVGHAMTHPHLHSHHMELGAGAGGTGGSSGFSAPSAASSSSNTGGMSVFNLISPVEGSGGSSGGSRSVHNTKGFDMEQWPRRQAMYHAAEWLEWFGCEDAMVRDPSSFS